MIKIYNSNISNQVVVQYTLLGVLFTFLTTYLQISLVIKIFDKKATRIGKIAFSFLAGVILQVGWEYLIFYVFKVDVTSKFAPLFYAHPLPIFAIAYYFLGTKVLGIHKIRLHKLMAVYYLCNVIVVKLNRFVLWNYIQDMRFGIGSMLQYIVFNLVMVGVLLILNMFVSRVFKKIISIVKMNEAYFVNQKRDMVIYIVNSFLVYGVAIGINYALNSASLSNLITAIFAVLFLMVFIFSDYVKVLENDNENKSAHVSTLVEKINNFSAVKHDFANVLQTYDGYLSLGKLDKLKEYHSRWMQTTVNAGTNMELSMKMNQNPALVALLLKKMEDAERNNVTMRVSIKTDLEDFYIDNMDLCRCAACLIDNAIEAASESTNKRVDISVEQKNDNGKLIVITNNTSLPVDVISAMSFGISTKSGHSGIGLSTVRSILGRYPNCTFKPSYYDLEFSVYIEMKQL